MIIMIIVMNDLIQLENNRMDCRQWALVGWFRINKVRMISYAIVINEITCGDRVKTQFSATLPTAMKSVE